MAAYDWRLPSPLLEERDQFFSRLAAQTELMVQKSGEKASCVLTLLGGATRLLYWNYFMVPRDLWIWYEACTDTSVWCYESFVSGTTRRVLTLVYGATSPLYMARRGVY
eukprot:52262-Rhodomonas_salina.2